MSAPAEDRIDYSLGVLAQAHADMAEGLKLLKSGNDARLAEGREKLEAGQLYLKHAFAMVQRDMPELLADPRFLGLRH